MDSENFVPKLSRDEDIVYTKMLAKLERRETLTKNEQPIFDALGKKDKGAPLNENDQKALEEFNRQFR